MDKLKVLIVDDEPPICNMVQRFLGMNNYQGDSASNGKEALSKIQNDHYDIVLTDIKMPEMDGLTLMKLAKSIKPELIFVIMSGYGTLDSAIECMKMGALNFIKKPISIVELIATIKKAEELIITRNVPVKMKPYLIHIDKELEISTKDLNNNLEMIVNYLVSEIKELGCAKLSVDNITMGLYEALSNAIEHGNLNLKKEISRENKIDVLDSFIKEKMEKLKLPEFANKKVKIKYLFSSDKFEFSIKDEGKGFNYREFLKGIDQNIYNDSLNKGLFLIKNVVHEVEFNDKGNEIKIIYYHDQEEK
jgi:YesN/AraC family two-component response regulator